MANSKQGNIKDIFSCWKHTKRNEKPDKRDYLTGSIFSCSI